MGCTQRVDLFAFEGVRRERGGIREDGDAGGGGRGVVWYGNLPVWCVSDFMVGSSVSGPARPRAAGLPGAELGHSWLSFILCANSNARAFFFYIRN